MQKSPSHHVIVKWLIHVEKARQHSGIHKHRARVFSSLRPSSISPIITPKSMCHSNRRDTSFIQKAPTSTFGQSSVQGQQKSDNISITSSILPPFEDNDLSYPESKRPFCSNSASSFKLQLQFDELSEAPGICKLEDTCLPGQEMATPLRSPSRPISEVEGQPTLFLRFMAAYSRTPTYYSTSTATSFFEACRVLLKPGTLCLHPSLWDDFLLWAERHRKKTQQLLTIEYSVAAYYSEVQSPYAHIRHIIKPTNIHQALQEEREYHIATRDCHSECLGDLEPDSLPDLLEDVGTQPAQQEQRIMLSFQDHDERLSLSFPPPHKEPSYNPLYVGVRDTLFEQFTATYPCFMERQYRGKKNAFYAACVTLVEARRPIRTTYCLHDFLWDDFICWNDKKISLHGDQHDGPDMLGLYYREVQTWEVEPRGVVTYKQAVRALKEDMSLRSKSHNDPSRRIIVVV